MVLEVADVEIVREHVTLGHLSVLADASFGDLVKAVVDVERGIMAIAGELHADEETALLNGGSSQANLWGINLYPAEHGRSDWIEFDSMINVRPRQGNRTRSVRDAAVRARIIEIIDRLVEP